MGAIISSLGGKRIHSSSITLLCLLPAWGKIGQQSQFKELQSKSRTFLCLCRSSWAGSQGFLDPSHILKHRKKRTSIHLALKYQTKNESEYIQYFMPTNIEEATFPRLLPFAWNLQLISEQLYQLRQFICVMILKYSSCNQLFFVNYNYSFPKIGRIKIFKLRKSHHIFLCVTTPIYISPVQDAQHQVLNRLSGPSRFLGQPGDAVPLIQLPLYLRASWGPDQWRHERSSLPLLPLPGPQ